MLQSWKLQNFKFLAFFDMSDNIKHTKKTGHNTKTEYEKRLHALSDGEIWLVFDYVCYSYEKCHERNCRNEISKNKSVSDSSNELENRERICEWI